MENTPLAPTVTIERFLSESLRRFVAEEVMQGGFADATAYIEHLLREEQRRTVQQRLVRLLRDGALAPTRERNEGDWLALRAALRRRASAVSQSSEV